MKRIFESTLEETEHSVSQVVEKQLEKCPIRTKVIEGETEAVEWNTGDGEVLLFHGTPRKNIEKILKEGFKAAKNRRSPYGKGTYLSDSAQKADQYTDCPNARGQHSLTMLVVRVGLGRVVGEDGRDDEASDTVVAGRDKLFREFVCKTDQLLFPQFLVVYDRT